MARLLRSAQAGADEIRFGHAHYTHAVCRDEKGWSLRLLELDPCRAAEHAREYGMFLPEQAEALSRPGSRLLHAESLDELIEALATGPWPLG